MIKPRSKGWETLSCRESTAAVAAVFIDGDDDARKRASSRPFLGNSLIFRNIPDNVQ